MYLAGLVLLFLFTDGISSTNVVRYREVHMDTELSCHEPSGQLKWFYKETQSATYFPITAENGSHYEISENIAGLRIVNTLESDEGFYLVQGDGGVHCTFQLSVYGLFSYNSGTKSGTGNYEETLYGVEGYPLIVPCDYNITEVSDSEDTFVNVDAVVNNENVADCEEETYPYCSGCEACFPLLNNPFRQYVVYPTRGSASSTLQCRVNLGTQYNGKTVDKLITIATRDISAETISLPYNTSYQLCSNAPGDRNAVIVTQSFSGGLPTNQIEYSAGNVPTLALQEDIRVSCQSLDERTFPIADGVYEYAIEITAIADLLSTTELISESACVDEVPEYLLFDCSYQVLGPSSDKQTVFWELNGATCTSEVCRLSGDYSEANRIEIGDLSPLDETYSVRCSVEINEVSYFKEWRIDFEECPTTTSIASIAGISPDSTTASLTQPNTTVTPTTLPLDSSVIVGIVIASVLSVIFVIILLVLLVIAIVLYLYWRSGRPRSYATNSNSNRLRNLFNHDPPSDYRTDFDPPPQTQTQTGSEISSPDQKPRSYATNSNLLKNPFKNGPQKDGYRKPEDLEHTPQTSNWIRNCFKKDPPKVQCRKPEDPPIITL